MRSEPATPESALRAFQQASAEVDFAQRFIARSNNPSEFSFTEGPGHLRNAINYAKQAVEIAEKQSGRPSLFTSQCKCFLASVLGLAQDFDEAEKYANEAKFYCSLIPMNEDVFEIWAKAAIYLSGALCGKGDHVAAIDSLETAKSQISGFQGVSPEGKSIFDSHISQLKRRFG